jgi:protein TonB
LLKPFRALADLNFERFREKARERLTGAVLALLAELVLVLAMLSLNFTGEAPKKPGALVSVTLEQDAPDSPDQAKPKAAPSAQSPQPPREVPDQPTPDVPVTPQVTPPPAIIPVSKTQMAQFDLRNVPQVAPAAKPKFGPADTGSPGDSKRIGSAPNGQPLYAAAWYREPYDSELSGYLSTADGPGWALIACRTVPEFRVEDCVGLDEYPNGSNIERSVLAAAWQFRVRPPRLGGVSKYGEWVRIRIDYGIRGK